MKTFHDPVMVQEVIDGLKVQRGKRYIDATVGGGGHARAIIKRGGMLLGIDQDREAVDIVKDGKIVWGNFRDIERIAKENSFDNADGILFDLGVSSHQLDTPQRGFSFRYRQAPWDLRMDQSKGIPAWEYIKKLSEEELYEILATFGEEKLARAIARAFVRARRVRLSTTVGDIAAVVDEVVPNPREATATLARVFQALRIAVNDELGALRDGLRGAAAILGSGGRFAVLSYHSLEDRVVKREIERLGLRAMNKRPMRPSAREQQENPRSRSAKLRIAEKL